MTALCRVAALLGAGLMFALAPWGWSPSEWSLTAQSAAQAKSRGTRSQGIVVVVNDQAITGYEIEQRAHFLGLSANVSERAKANFKKLLKSDSIEEQLRELQREVISSNPGKTRDELIAIFKKRQKEFGLSLQKRAVRSARAAILPKLKKEAKEELIDERLKLQAAKKLGIVVSDDEVNKLIGQLAKRNKMSYEEFTKHLKGMGVDISTMREKFRAQKAWRDLVGRRWAAQVSVSQRDVDRLLSTTAIKAGKDTVELLVKKVSLPVDGRGNQAALTKRYAEAVALRRRISSCKRMAEVARDARNTRFEDMKYVKPSAVGEPTRSMLLSAKDGDVLPPVTTSEAVVLYGVCGRRSVAGNDAQRRQALQQLRSKELEILARRHLRNLRQEANIEYR